MTKLKRKQRQHRAEGFRPNSLFSVADSATRFIPVLVSFGNLLLRFLEFSQRIGKS